MSKRQKLITATFAFAAVAAAAGVAQSPARDALERGRTLWNQRLTGSAIKTLEVAAKAPETAAEANELLGRLYTFKGWQQDNVFPGWHDEPLFREKAIAALKASLAADASRVSAQEALKVAEGFAAADKVDPAPPQDRARSLDAQLQAYRSLPDTPIAEIEKAIDGRARAQADPAPYFAGAQILIERGEYDKAIDWAERGAKASDRFIDDNLSAYQMAGKAQGSYARGRGTAADLIGWSLFLKKDLKGAAARLDEASRLLQGQDFGNLYHLGELARAQSQPDVAREHYLNALALSGGPAPLRQKTSEALSALQPTARAADFPAWLESELTRRRDDRRMAALKSLVDKKLPSLVLTALDGKPFDAKSMQGKVVLLDFFASWCGICKAELPHIKAAYARYQNDPGVAFVLVSVDDDAKRLRRYLDDMKFPFPVARMAIDDAEKVMGFDNVPATFYVDKHGTVRYQLNGSESHGDSPARVGWFIEQLKQLP